MNKNVSDYITATSDKHSLKKFIELDSNYLVLDTGWVSDPSYANSKLG